MKKHGRMMLTVLVIISQLCSVLTLETTGSAFMWSPHIDREFDGKVNYQTLSSRDLARSIMSSGSWSNILCKGDRPHPPVDIAVVFVGKELQSSGITSSGVDSSLVNLLKDSFVKSNFSMAYPYVSSKLKDETMESSLIKEFEEFCDYKLGGGKIFVTESCSTVDKGYSKLADMHSVEEHVLSRIEKGISDQTDVLFVCRGGFSSSTKFDRPRSEGGHLSELISSLDHSGAKYTVLYVSDPYNPTQYSFSHQIGRLLAENVSGNTSLNSTVFCDGVCQVKKTLLEAVFVVIVLLIVLISGLCCMMGIDTPGRFEVPQES